jgi:hypothetical protein
MIELLVLSSLAARLKALKRYLTGCCLGLIVAALLACGLFLGLSAYLVKLASAQEPSQTPLEVLLLIDNSNSMFELGGIGSDPNLLRIQAARLFITYLGVDSAGPPHRLGVIFFGGEAHLVAPLTQLADDTRRAELAHLLDQPQRLTWTDPAAALELAENTLRANDNPAVRRVIVLLTDGKPEWSATPTETEKAAVSAHLRELAGRLANQDTSLFIILLQNQATDADPEIGQVYIPLWQELTALTPTGHFYQARHSDDLLGIYHDIVVALTGRQTAGPVIQTQVQTETVESVQVEPGLRQVTLVVRKSDPALQVAVIRPDGHDLSPTEPGVRHGGQPGQSREEIWAISAPPAGQWQIRLNGQGRVTVWKDFYPAVPTPTFTPSPSTTFTPPPALTPTPTITPPPALTPTPALTLPPAPAPARPSTATSTPAPTPAPPPPLTAGSFNPAWGVCLGILPLLLTVGGGGWWWVRQRQAAPHLTGILRLVGRLPLTGSATIPASLDLDTLSRRQMTIGPEPGAAFHLPQTPDHPTPSVWLKAQLDPDGQPGVYLRVGFEPVQVNGVPIIGERLLRDGDVIRLGDYQFKYDNLRQRVEGGWRRGYGLN